MRYGSVCSGIEAASVAWHPLGWGASFLSEIDPAARAVLAHRFPGVPLHGDFTTIQAGQYQPIDLLVGGTPCQDFSVAGLRKGLAGERGNLTLEFLRLADRLRPRWLCWENVPGVLSQDAGRAFGAILGGMAELGYGFAYRVLDAQYIRVDGFGRAVPQRRRRVFVVGCLGDWRRAAAVLFERACLSGDPTPRREARAIAAASLTGSLGRRGGVPDGGDTDGHLIAFQGRGSNLDIGGDVAATLGTNIDRASSGAPCLAFGGNDTRGPIKVATALNAHGGPAGRLDFESETFIAAPIPILESGKRTGASSVDRKAGDGIGQPGDPMFTLGADSRHAICFNSREDPEVTWDRAGPLGASSPQAQAIAFDTTQITSRSNYSRPEPGDPCHPLAAGAHPPAIALSVDKAHALIGHNGGPPMRWAVRRLTPTECERLQGFPDGWTLVPWRGGLMPDGPRYKMLGNSMACNVMAWIGTRIDMVEAIP